MKEIAKYIIHFLTHRLFILSVVAVVLFAVLLSRLFELQIINGEAIEKNFDLFVLRDIKVEGQRGAIYDRNGNPLAVNKIAYEVQFDSSVYNEDKNAIILELVRILHSNGDELTIDFPIVISKDNLFEFQGPNYKINAVRKYVLSGKEKETHSLYTAEELMTILFEGERKILPQNVSFDSLTKKETLDLVKFNYMLYTKGFYRFIPDVIAENISYESLAQINERKAELIGITIAENSLRYYPDAEYFSHIIGYTGKISSNTLKEYKQYGYNHNDTIGLIGIEEAMEFYLHSEDGQKTVEVDVLGRTRNTVEVEDAVAGKDVYLTIDAELQKNAQDILEKHLAYIVANKLVMKQPKGDDETLPLLKDVYYSLFKNKVIDIDFLVHPVEKNEQLLSDRFQMYYNERTALLQDTIFISSLTYNEELRIYYEYMLKKLVSGGYLSDKYENTPGFKEFSNDTISFHALLQYYIKEGFLNVERDFIIENREYTLDNEQTFAYLTEKIILPNYFNTYQFRTLIMLEMVDLELFPYKELCQVLVEQKIIEIDSNIIDDLQENRLSPLEYTKYVIENLLILPRDLGLDPSTGAVVVTDVDTGDVLALVNYPSYDNNLIAGYDYYASLLASPTRPLYPTATQGKTAPGSTFKPVSAMAGLDTGVITKDSVITCTGVFDRLSPPVHCWIARFGSSHGAQNVRQALTVSCNVFFNEIGYRLSLTEDNKYDPYQGTRILSEYAAKFGLDAKTGIEIDEVGSSLPGSKASGTINATTAAMGQEYNAYTPVQISRYVSTLANGGDLYDLTLVDRIYNSSGSLYKINEPKLVLENNFNPKYVDIIKEGMYGVTNSTKGSATKYFKDCVVEVAGKTGTAQENRLRPNHALFVSFAPYENPEISVVVVVPYSITSQYTSSFIAGQVARDIYNFYYDVYESEQENIYIDEKKEIKEEPVEN